MHKICAACSRAAFDFVSCHADIVGRSRPREIDLRRGSCRSHQVGGHRWRGGIGSGRCCGRENIRIGAVVPSSIDGTYTIRVRSRSRERAIAERSCCGRRNLYEISAPGSGASFQFITNDANVIGRGHPCEIDLGGESCRCCQICRRCRRHRIRSWRRWLTHQARAAR